MKRVLILAGLGLLALLLNAGLTQAQQGVRFKGQAITEPLGPDDAPSYAVQGRVTSAEGAGLGGITVRIFTDGWEGATTSTRGDGYYDFARLSLGNYKVTLLGVEADTIISGKVDGRTRVIVNFVRSPVATATPAGPPATVGPPPTPTLAPPTPTPIPATLPTIISLKTATPLPAGTPRPADRSSILSLFNLDFHVQLPDLRPLGNAFCLGGFCFMGLLAFVGIMSLARTLIWPSQPYQPRTPRLRQPPSPRRPVVRPGGHERRRPASPRGLAPAPAPPTTPPLFVAEPAPQPHPVPPVADRTTGAHPTLAVEDVSTGATGGNGQTETPPKAVQAELPLVWNQPDAAAAVDDPGVATG